jgi:alpha-glucosidase
MENSNMILKHQWELKSPNGNLEVKVILDEKGTLAYQIEKEGSIFLEYSPLGINTSICDFSQGLIYKDLQTSVIDETYQLVAGKKNLYINHANEMRLNFNKEGKDISVIFRAYDDGIAFRYDIPGEDEIKIFSESTSFTVPRELLVNVWAQSFMKCYEYTYNQIMPEHMANGRFAFPLLFQVGKKGWMLVTEAGVYGEYCGCHVQGCSEYPDRLQVAYAPDQEGPIIGNRPFVTPWRVAIIGELQTIVNNSIIENLNPSCELEDTSWIKPGRAAWSWYTGKNQCCSDLDYQKKYVDFASEMGWEYSLIDAGWPHGLDVAELVKYAYNKNVGIWLWVNSKEMLEESGVRERLKKWSEWGIKGVKIDFFDSDSQAKIRVYDMIARVAAEYKLMINYHGSTKTSGEQRRWPHIMTREGILGAEYLSGWSDVYIDGPTAAHNCTVPFTRNAIGPMDYTPVTFTKNRRVSTYAHQVALAVIFESHIQNFADSIEAYEECAAKEFLKAVHTSWDDTILLEGYPGLYATIARKKDKEWYIGAICALNARETNIPLNFLEDGEYTASIYWDGLNADIIHLHMTEMEVETRKVSKGDILKIPMKINGGCAVRLVKDK